MSVRPADIFEILSKDVIGQDDVLKHVSVAIFKHAYGEPFGNVMIIGNSGTGKTSIMRSVERMYMKYPFFEKHRAVIRMNANTLANEEGQVITGKQLFQTMQSRATQILGRAVTREKIKQLIEHSTICIDEVDKITATVGGRPNPVGINVQQSLLTLMEDEIVHYDTRLLEDGDYKPVQMEIDTSSMLFICGGAFEELYNQVFSRVVEDEGQDKLTQMITDPDGNVQFKQFFSLAEHVKQEDLFNYGMLPQFLSRFDTTLILRELTPRDLQRIFFESKDCLFEVSKRFFKRIKIDLKVTEKARERIGFQASLQPRLGARALKEIYNQVIKPFEFDPFATGAVTKLDGDTYELTLSEEIVKDRLGLK